MDAEQLSHIEALVEAKLDRMLRSLIMWGVGLFAGIAVPLTTALIASSMQVGQLTERVNTSQGIINSLVKSKEELSTQGTRTATRIDGIYDTLADIRQSLKEIQSKVR